MKSHPEKKKKPDCELDDKVSIIHYYIKLYVVTEMVDKTKEVYVFPRTPIEGDYNCVSMDGLRSVSNLQTKEERPEFLNERVQLGRSVHYVPTYFERANGRIHDSILTKILNAFVSGLPSKHPLSTTSRAHSTQKKKFSRLVDHVSEYYESKEYNKACNLACFTYFPELIVEVATYLCNIPGINSKTLTFFSSSG